MSTESRVLVVDDDPVFAETLARSLERRGYRATIANQADRAISLCRETLFGVILLDMKIGPDSGLRILPTLREAQPQAKIILITGYSSIVTAVEAVKSGADNYLAKPVGISDILAEIEPGFAEKSPEPLLRPSVDRIEWEHIQRVLAANNHNISATARDLGMHRRTLQRKLAKKPVQR